MCLFFIQITIKEEDRLSSVIAEIDHDVRIVPRGAFVKTPTNEITANRTFEGKYNFNMFHSHCTQGCICQNSNK